MWTQERILSNAFFPPTIHIRHRMARGRGVWRITGDGSKAPRAETLDPRATWEGDEHRVLKTPTLAGRHQAYGDESTWSLPTQDCQSSK